MQDLAANLARFAYCKLDDDLALARARFEEWAKLDRLKSEAATTWEA